MRYILYHGNCYDGFGAAYACWKKFGYEGTCYIAVSYGEPLPIDLADPIQYLNKDLDEIYIVDFSYPYQTLNNLAPFCKKLVVLDHHKTAQAELENKPWSENVDIVFDMKRSGALITWEYLHTVGGAVGGEVPVLIRHISDRDLWEFKLPGTKEIHKALVSYPMNFEIWDNFDIEILKKEGITCDRMYSSLVKNIIDKAWVMKLDGHRIWVVNTSIAWSEVGHELCKKHDKAPFCATFTVFENNVMWSLRSIGDFDVSEVAKKFSGGGHKNAAGFKTPRF